MKDIEMWKAVSRLTVAHRPGAILVIALAGTLCVGCAGNKPKAKDPVFQQGWVGGQYKLAHVPRLFSPHDSVNAFPAALSHAQKAGVLVMRLGTNAPAQAAGLREGDVILEINHQPVTTLRTFRRHIEQSEPGSWLSVNLWRNGQFEEKRICVGKETYRRQGVFALGLILHNFNFAVNPGFSLAVLGYQPNPGHHIDLASVDQEFSRKCSAGPYQPSEQDWAVWLAIVEVSKGKIILAQEPAPQGNSL
ncbi:MAG TPA: PDZ domain-containing protein [Verrucomicrobiae bacterium]